MHRAGIETLVPLDRFAKIFGIHPLHFNQVTLPGFIESQVCDSPLIQHPWQDADRASRDEIAEAIQDAERGIAEAIGFKLLPSWEIYDLKLYKRPAIPELIALSPHDIRGLYRGVRTKWKHVQYGGVKALTLIQANAPIVFTDHDLDTYFETATITVPTTVTNSEEIKIFYPGKAGESGYEIRPIIVTISGGIATITCKREQLVLEDLLESFTAEAIDGFVDANFLTTVDVYRVYNDPSTQAQIIWNSLGGCGVCAACTKTYQDACINVDDGEIGLVRVEPATWNATTLQFDPANLNACRAPDSVRMWYKAGWKYNNSDIIMDPLWERAICRFAAAQLHRPLCGCESVTNYTEYWQEDMASRVASPSGMLSFRYRDTLFENPFGTKRGHIYAWRIAQQYIGGGVNA